MNKLCEDRYKAESAGVTPTQVNPYAAEVMAEISVDLSQHRSKSMMEFKGRTFDYVVTVCDSAHEVCPFFPGEKEIHTSFSDPTMPVMAAMPVVLSPKTLPCTIRTAPVKHRAMPTANRVNRNVRVFSFYTPLFISNFILYITNLMLNIYNTIFKHS